MTEITQCPKCSTRFKVTGAQLDAHDGLVRCGRCHEVFDAGRHLHDDEPSPQLSLPIEPEPVTGEIDLTPHPQRTRTGRRTDHLGTTSPVRRRTHRRSA